jgi:hypothetical protein
VLFPRATRRVRHSLNEYDTRMRNARRWPLVAPESAARKLPARNGLEYWRSGVVDRGWCEGEERVPPTDSDSPPPHPPPTAASIPPPLEQQLGRQGGSAAAMRKALELMLWALMGAVVTFVLFSKPRVRSPLHQCQPTRDKPYLYASLPYQRASLASRLRVCLQRQ